MPCARRWTGCCQCSFAPPGRDLGPGAGQLYERRRSRGRANAQGLALWSGTGWCAWPRTKRGGDLVCFGRPPASTGVDAHRVARAASRRRPHVTCRDWPPTTAGRRWLALLPSAREELGSQRGELATRVLESATTSRACTPIDGALASPRGQAGAGVLQCGDAGDREGARRADGGDDGGGRGGCALRLARRDRQPRAAAVRLADAPAARLLTRAALLVDIMASDVTRRSWRSDVQPPPARDSNHDPVTLGRARGRLAPRP